MARLTKQERDLLAQLSEKAKAEDEEDSAYEVWVKNERGHQVQLTGAKARKFMAQFGLDDDEEAGEETTEESEEELPADEPPASDKGYWKGRK